MYTHTHILDTPLDGVVTVQTSSPTTTNAELATSDQSFTEEINDTNPRKCCHCAGKILALL